MTKINFLLGAFALAICFNSCLSQNSNFTSNAKTCNDCNSTNADCNIKQGYVLCSCKSGFVGNGLNCTRMVFCDNTCCPPGYTWDITKKSCVDVNECLDSSLYKCLSQSQCLNRNGIYLCNPPQNPICPDTPCNANQDCVRTGSGTGIACIDPCTNYIEIDGSQRLYTMNSVGRFPTDRYLFGWYRYANNLRLREGYVGPLKCGSVEPFTLSSHPSVSEGVKSVSLLTNGLSSNSTGPSILVRACPGGYYVYKFTGMLKSEVYCTDFPSTTTSTTTTTTTTTTPVTTTTTTTIPTTTSTTTPMTTTTTTSPTTTTPPIPTTTSTTPTPTTTTTPTPTTSTISTTPAPTTTTTPTPTTSTISTTTETTTVPTTTTTTPPNTSDLPFDPSTTEATTTTSPTTSTTETTSESPTTVTTETTSESPTTVTTETTSESPTTVTTETTSESPTTVTTETTSESPTTLTTEITSESPTSTTIPLSSTTTSETTDLTTPPISTKTPCTNITAQTPVIPTIQHFDEENITVTDVQSRSKLSVRILTQIINNKEVKSLEINETTSVTIKMRTISASTIYTKVTKTISPTSILILVGSDGPQTFSNVTDNEVTTTESTIPNNQTFNPNAYCSSPAQTNTVTESSAIAGNTCSKVTSASTTTTITTTEEVIVLGPDGFAKSCAYH